MPRRPVRIILPAVIALGLIAAAGPGAWALAGSTGFTDIGVDQKLGGTGRALRE